MGRLVLSRRLGEGVYLRREGDGPEQEILVTVHEIQGGKVRLSFVAPDDVIVLREELRGREVEPEGRP